MPEIIIPAKSEGYAIIGTREPDEAQITVARHLAFAIAIIGGKIVRTGAAHGIDEQAMQGTGGRNLEVYLPWSTYNKCIIPSGANIIVYNPAIHQEWTASVQRYHPAASSLSSGAFSLHARNFGIVVGATAVIALPDSSGGGGTAQGIRIAKDKGILVIQGNRGSITDSARWIGKALQQLGFANKDLSVTLPGR